MGKNKQIYIVIGVIIVVILMFVFIRSLSIKKARIADIDSIINENNYTLFFSGDLTKEEKKKLKSIRDENDIKIYQLTDSNEEVINYIKSKENAENVEGNIYLLFDSKSYLGYIDNTKDKDEYLKKYLYGYLPKAERVYNVTSVNDYNQLFNSKNTTIAVFGDYTCSYCERLQNVINNVVKNKVYDIYYFDTKEMSETEYNSLMDMKITVPAKCNSMEKEQTMSEGYAKPMTIVSKKGKVIGCIKGYYDYATYVEKLKEIMEG
ncbi:MAG: hypothetical protein IKP76_03420 [Bacilli bacterium]|nr:hypothetical protein [Bacilli bacterium]